MKLSLAALVIVAAAAAFISAGAEAKVITLPPPIPMGSFKAKVVPMVRHKNIF